MIRRGVRRRTRRGTVVMVVLWAVAIAALVTAAVQMTSFRQASLGRESHERIAARWAARSGIEHTLAVMRLHTEEPEPGDAFALARDMEYVALGDTLSASWDILHNARDNQWYGPMDEHSKMNVNNTNFAHLMLLENMWLDIADAIMEWVNPEYEPTGLSVGRQYYRSLRPPYEPRMGPMHNIAELELVAGVWPKYLRGEDWNFNGRLDAIENNCGQTFPPDDCDGVLDAGWSALLTAHSVEGGPSASGLPRLYLGWATIEEVMERFGLDEDQAKALIRFGRNPDSRLEQLLTQPLSHVDNSGAMGDQPYNDSIQPLDDDQLTAVLDEVILTDPLLRLPGRMNINTIPRELLLSLFELYGIDQMAAEEIIYLRDSRPEGIASIVELREIPELEESGALEQIAGLFCTQSAVYTIASKGRSWGTGVEVEIIVTVDRSTVPIRILEYREQ